MPSIKKNFVYSTFYQVFTLITPLITTPYISRILEPDGIGIYSYTASIQTYFSMFAALGVLGYGSREIARNRDDKKVRSKIFWEIETMVVVTTLIAVVIWIAMIVNYAEYRIYFVVLTMNLIAVIFDISWFFTGLEEFKIIVVKSTIVKLITIGLLFLLVREKSDLVMYIGLMAAGTLAGNLSMWTKLPHFICKINYKQIRIKHHVKESFVYFVPTIATSVYTILDKTMIGIITNDSYQNGYYEQATKIINLAKSVTFVALNSVMGARASYLFNENKLSEVHDKMKVTLNYILLMGMGMCFGLIGISGGLVSWFFGDGYDSVVWLLRIFCPIIVIIGISNCIGSLYYTPIGKRALSAKFIIAGSVTNLIFNVILIPRIGARGAALSSIFAELVITVLYVSFCEDYVTVRMILQLSWRKLIAGVIMLGVILLIGRHITGTTVLTFIQIICGITVYGCLLLIMKDEYLFSMTREMFKNIRKG